MTDSWTMVAETRTDLASYLETLTSEQWDAPSLCAEWKVRDVVGHVVEGANKAAMGKMMGGMLKHGFNMNKMLASMAIEEGKRTPEDLSKAVRKWSRCGQKLARVNLLDLPPSIGFEPDAPQHQEIGYEAEL